MDDQDDKCTCQAPDWCGATRRDMIAALSEAGA